MKSNVEKKSSHIEPLFIPLRAGFAAIGIGPTKGYQLVKERKISVIKIGRKSLASVANIRAVAAAFIEEAARGK